MMAEFCAHELHGGVCKKTNDYCNLGACPYEEMREYATVRNGRWLSWEDQFNKTPKRKNNLGVFCDKCHKHNDNRTDYCPNCGAKMDGGVEDEV